MAFCVKCGAALPDAANYCGSCGSKILATVLKAVDPPPPDEQLPPARSNNSKVKSGSTAIGIPAKKQGMLWASWCIYFSYPLGGALTLANSLTQITKPTGITLAVLASFQLLTWIFLLRRSKVGWYLNFILWFVVIMQASFKSADILVNLFCAAVLMVCCYVPNAVYWYKRKWLFESGWDIDFRNDWKQVFSVKRAIPIVTAVLVIPLLAAIAIPAYDSYVKRNKTAASTAVPPLASPHRDLLPYEKRAWSGNVFDQFDDVNSIVAKAQAIPQLREHRAWEAVLAWQHYFTSSGAHEPNVAIYMGVDSVLEGLKASRGVCRPGDVQTVDAAHASKEFPAGTELTWDECDVPPLQ